MKGAILKLFLLLLIHIILNTQANADIEEDTWMYPDAWARDHLSSSACCEFPKDVTQNDNSEHIQKEQKQTMSEDVAFSILYKKLITMFFNRNFFEYDPILQKFERSIVFTVKSSQMEKLEHLQDPRDLDNILTDIFNNVRIAHTSCDGQCKKLTTGTSSGFASVLLDIFYDMLKLTKTSEIRFLLVVTLVILIAWMVHNRINIGWLPLIFAGIFIFGYLHTYLECNRELEVKQLSKVLNLDKKGENMAKEYRFVKFLRRIFSSDDTKDVQYEQLKQSAKVDLGFCRPDHVLILYFNDIFLKYLQVLLEQFTITLTNLNEELGFPYNILTGFLLVVIIGYILKLLFKYILSPKVWVNFMHQKQSYHHMPEQTAIGNSTYSNGDRISGDNLKLLLNAFTSVPQQSTISPTLRLVPTISGVEEVKEALEPPSNKTSPELDENTSVKTQNNNSKEISFDENTDVTLKDLCDDL